MSEVSVRIQRDLYDKIKRIVEKNKEEFSSIEEYITFVLQQVVEEEPEQIYTAKEEKEVKERLRRLGYI